MDIPRRCEKTKLTLHHFKIYHATIKTPSANHKSTNISIRPNAILSPLKHSITPSTVNHFPSTTSASTTTTTIPHHSPLPRDHRPRERAAFCKPRGEKRKEAVRVASCNFSVLSEKVKREGEKERERQCMSSILSLHPQPAAITPNRNTTAAPPQPGPPHPVCERAERERKLQFCRVSELHCEVISGLRYVDQG